MTRWTVGLLGRDNGEPFVVDYWKVMLLLKAEHLSIELQCRLLIWYKDAVNRDFHGCSFQAERGPIRPAPRRGTGRVAYGM